MIHEGMKTRRHQGFSMTWLIVLDAFQSIAWMGTRRIGRVYGFDIGQVADFCSGERPVLDH
jgi:hypothetical protein